MLLGSGYGRGPPALPSCSPANPVASSNFCLHCLGKKGMFSNMCHRGMGAQTLRKSSLPSMEKGERQEVPESQIKPCRPHLASDHQHSRHHGPHQHPPALPHGNHQCLQTPAPSAPGEQGLQYKMGLVNAPDLNLMIDNLQFENEKEASGGQSHLIPIHT